MWSSGCAARQNTCTLAYGTFHVVEVELDRRTFGNLCPFGIGSLQFEVPRQYGELTAPEYGETALYFCFFKYDCHDFTFWLLFVRKCFSPRLCEFFALRFGRGHRESRTFPFQPCGNQIFLHVCEVVADRFFICIVGDDESLFHAPLRNTEFFCLCGDEIGPVVLGLFSFQSIALRFAGVVTLLLLLLVGFEPRRFLIVGFVFFALPAPICRRCLTLCLEFVIQSFQCVVLGACTISVRLENFKERFDPADCGFNLRFIGDGFFQNGGYSVESLRSEPQIRILGFQRYENFLFHVFSFYMVSNKSSYSHKKGLSADANRPTNNYMKVISFCNWWAATSQPLRQKSVCSAHYANYIKGKFVKKRGEQFSLSENSFIEMIHSKKCEK
nr:MAG TPA: hypothetical protein [Caudoviricetes sp.]